VTQPSSQLAYPIVQSLTSSNALTAGTLPFRAAAWPCTCPLSTVGVYPVPKTVSCQRFWPDSTWAFSGVTPSTGTTAANNLWLGAQTHIPSLNHQLTKLDDRDMTPILRKYRWHELLSGVGSTGQDIKTLTSLFLFLLRATISPDAQYPVTIDRHLEDAISPLDLVLPSAGCHLQDNTVDIQVIFRIIISLLQQSPPNAHRQQFTYPLLSFIVVAAARRPDAAFARPDDLIRLLAKIQWTILHLSTMYSPLAHFHPNSCSPSSKRCSLIAIDSPLVAAFNLWQLYPAISRPTAIGTYPKIMANS